MVVFWSGRRVSCGVIDGFYAFDTIMRSHEYKRMASASLFIRFGSRCLGAPVLRTSGEPLSDALM